MFCVEIPERLDDAGDYRLRKRIPFCERIACVEDIVQGAGLIPSTMRFVCNQSQRYWRRTLNSGQCTGPTALALSARERRRSSSISSDDADGSNGEATSQNDVGDGMAAVTETTRSLGGAGASGRAIKGKEGETTSASRSSRRFSLDHVCPRPVLARARTRTATSEHFIPAARRQTAASLCLVELFLVRILLDQNYRRTRARQLQISWEEVHLQTGGMWKGLQPACKTC
jgi:hypothetical protein